MNLSVSVRAHASSRVCMYVCVKVQNNTNTNIIIVALTPWSFKAMHVCVRESACMYVCVKVHAFMCAQDVPPACRGRVSTRT